MISSKSSLVVARSSTLILQSRLLSTSLPNLKESRREGMDRKMLLQQAKDFFGPKNSKGDYVFNRFYFPPRNNKPRYIVNDGNPLKGEQFKGKRPGKNFYNKERIPSMHPFPNNTYTKTAHIIPDHLKDQIVEDSEFGLHPQELAHKFGINLLRIEAILKLKAIEKEFQPDKKYEKDLKFFAESMKRMFPVYKGAEGADNLTEIPTPQKTLHDRFLTIEEAQPFGPVDAAKILQLEPAGDTLKKLAEFDINETEKQKAADDRKKLKVVYGNKRQCEKVQFKFIEREVGTFGHRYGASRRDRKKDRAIGFDASGKMIYLHPEQ